MTKTQHESPILLTQVAAAAVLGVHVQTVRDFIRAGRLRTVPVGTSVRVPRSELDAFVERELQRSGEE